MQGTKDQTNSTLFSSCSTEIIPLISDHRQIEVLRNIIDIHILRSQILHTFTFPLLNRPIFRMFRMYKRPKFRMFRQCFLCQHFPVLNVITAVSSCSQIFFWQTVNVICSLLFFFHHRFAVSTNKELFRSQLMTYYVQDRKTCTHVQERKSPNNFQNYDTDLFWIFFFASRSRVFINMLTVFCHHFDALGGWKHAYPPVPARLAIGAVEFPRVIESVLTALVSSVERRTHETTDAIC